MITLTFESYEEMKEYAHQLLGLPVAGKQPSTTPGPAPQSRGTYQQQAPIVPQSSIPTAPVQTAPTTPPPSVASVAPQQQVAPTQTTPIMTPVQTTAATYTLDDLSRAAMPLMDAGKQEDLIRLVGQFGVASLQDLPPEQYGAFATALRGMGAQI